MKQNKGFTLLELLIVIAITFIFGVMIIVGVTAYSNLKDITIINKHGQTIEQSTEGTIDTNDKGGDNSL